MNIEHWWGEPELALDSWEKPFTHVHMYIIDKI